MLFPPQKTDWYFFRFQIDLEDLQVEFERINGQVAVAEKKLKTFDKVCFEFFKICTGI